MACVLRGRLPADVVQHIQTLAAATCIQAIARAMLVRVHRMPMCRHGFEPLAAFETCQGVYQYGGEDFERDLERWTASLRPGAYLVWLRTVHPDGVSTTIGPERMLVSPQRVGWSLLRDWELYSLAFVPIHGRPCEYHIHVTTHVDGGS